MSKNFERMEGQFWNFAWNLIRHMYIGYKRMRILGKKGQFFNNFIFTTWRKGFRPMESVLPISSLFHILFLFLELEIASIQHLQEIHQFNLHFGDEVVEVLVLLRS